MKKIIVFLLVFLGVFLIYYLSNKQINYVSLNDFMVNDINYNNYIDDYLINKNKKGIVSKNFSNRNIKSMYKDIKNNRTVQYKDDFFYIKKVLRESDLVVISIGMEELAKEYDKYNMDKNYLLINEIYNDINNLIIEIKKYAKGKIVFLGYYNPTDYYDSKVDEFFYDVDVRFNRLMLNNDIIYIDLYELVKGNKYKGNSYLLNTSGYQKIASLIEFYIK